MSSIVNIQYYLTHDMNTYTVLVYLHCHSICSKAKLGSLLTRHGVIKKVIEINCNLITFSKIIECNCN